MKASRLATLAAAAAFLLSFAGLPAAAQTAAPETGEAVKPIMAPPAAKKTAAHTRAKTNTAKSQAHVYLFRGLLNIFSMGMDELADKIKASGIPATVYNHTEWEEVAGRIVADYKNGNRGPIVLIGHSLGADAVIFMADALGKSGVPVALVVPFDGTQTLVAPSNVARVMNITQRDYAFARRGAGFHGELQNVDVSSQGVDHLNIDKSPRLHAMVLNKIVAVVKRGEVPAEFAVVPGETKERAKPTPKPAPAEVAAKPAHIDEPEKRAVEAVKHAPAEAAIKPIETSKAEAKPLVPAAAAAPAAPVTAPATSVAAAPSTAPVSAPAASAPKAVSAPAAGSSPRPATERLEYEKLVLPKH